MNGKVTIVGSYNVGFVVYTDRLPVEGETLPGHGFRFEHGGKGSNQAIQAARLGCATSIVARVGRDIFGEKALQKWKAERIDTSHVVSDDRAATGAGLVIVVPNGKNMIVVDLGANMRLSIDDVAAASDKIHDSDVVLTQLEIPFETALYALRKSDGTRILNPAPAREITPETLKDVDIITPNEVEVLTMAGCHHSRKADITSIAEKYARYVGCVVVTMGEKGALVVSQNMVKHVNTPQIDAVDSTGAGDAFNGALASAIANGYDLLEAVEYACCAGAFLAARLKGGELVESLANTQELQKFISQHQPTLKHVGKRADNW
ncbi:MAG: ribokinase [Candidatus Caldarchaeum sp.]|uniref:Ribokinase n=1 Tax=Caldiarchaeum subterraneum TaxID=311458 RepID=A0A7C5QRJ4_CALS0